MAEQAAQSAPHLLLMSRDDNCLIARTQLAAGDAVDIDGARVLLPAAVPLGYKVARVALAPGDRVLRYGAPIGTVTAPVAQGAILHTHNLVSDYIPTHYSPTPAPAEDGRSFTGSTHRP